MKTPKAPDPVATAQAQSGMNRDTAVTQQYLNMVNQHDPYGSRVFTQSGTGGFTDSQGNWIEVPTFTETVTLAPEQQRILDQTNAASENLARIANQQSSFLEDYLGKGIDTSGFAPIQTGVNLNSNFDSRIGGSYTDTLGQDYTTNLGNDWRTSYAGADDFSADRQRYEDALWERQAGDRTQARSQLESQLVNRGLRPGTAAWDSELARLSRAENDARLGTILAAGDEQARMVNLSRDAAQFSNDANLTRASFGNQSELAKMQAQNAAAAGQAQFGQQAQSLGNQAALQQAQFQNAARAQQMQEQFALRNQPINEIGALLSGGQVTNPTFGATPQSPVAGVDYTGLVNQKYQSELAAYQAGMGGLFGLGSALIGALPFSDARLKENIKRVGSTDGGTPIYVYNYKGDRTPHMGVMAQDVPQARVVDPETGYYRVDYRRVS